MRTAVLVSGSREWTNRAVVLDRLRRYPAGTILIHGDCRGLDRMAAMVGRSLKFNIHSIPYFGDLGLAGGHERNRCMFGDLLNKRRFGFAIFVEAFPLKPTGGTQGLIALVENYNTRTPLEVPLWKYPYAA